MVDTVETKAPEATSDKPVTNPSTAADADDSDPDFDDLDDVLDQFSANAPPTKPETTQAPPQATPKASGPGRPKDNVSLPAGPQPNESEEQFIARLTAEMQTMISSLESDTSMDPQSPEDLAKMGKQLEEFTYKMEQQGIQPEDLLKAILGEEEGTKLAQAAHEDAKKNISAAPSAPKVTAASTSTSTSAAPAPDRSTSPAASSSSKPAPTSFEDTIRRTMSRLETSNTEATNATQSSTAKSEEDLLAEMLRTLEAGGAGGAGDEAGISKMFADMMQQLTHKDMLYEPMKELHSQYPAWLGSHKPPKIPQAEFDRYTRQSRIVSEIVNKFEEPGFSDDDAGCREYVWEKMQEMQGEGAPPEELVKNPFPGTDFGGVPGLGGGAGMEGLEEGCPTQ